MKIADQANLEIFKVAIAGNNLIRNPWFRVALLAAISLPSIACLLGGAAQQAAHAIGTVTPGLPHLDPGAISATPEAFSLHHPLILNADPTCHITDWGQLGAHGQSFDFPSAIPQDGPLQIVCGDQSTSITFDYSEKLFGTTTFVMGPDGTDNLTRMAEMGPDLRAIPQDANLQCGINAFATPMNTHNNVLLGDGTTQQFVAPITTAGNTSSILLKDMNTSALPFSIHPEVIEGAGGGLVDHGFFGWALLEKIGEKLSFLGILNPSCPVVIE